MMIDLVPSVLHIAIPKYCQTKCCGFCCELGGQPGDSESVNSGAGWQSFRGSYPQIGWLMAKGVELYTFTKAIQ